MIRVRTETGSVYLFRTDKNGQWWVAGSNMVNSQSQSLADGEWMIEPLSPWPPQIGASLYFFAPQDLAKGDPRRCPGGGKITSPVVDVEYLS